MSETTLMALWSRHKQACRPIGGIIADARAGRLPGIEPLPTGFGHRVVDEVIALSAMQRSN
ncbi:hypothetical protein ABMA32_22380 [Mesorhizobium sp. VNQ89]|uniref:hypothetical protein n=1 Tax=Mesorhizobium quangtriensis TaxID=3157709 RepID=UPI0032B824C9